jgi:hypothetical protein
MRTLRDTYFWDMTKKGGVKKLSAVGFSCLHPGLQIHAMVTIISIAIKTRH